MEISISPHYKYANQTLEWLPSDTEHRYNQNLKENFETLKKYGWIDHYFTYKFNSHGFRCQEFSEKKSILFLGCSRTQGIGLPLESTWPTMVSQQLNLECFNLGIGGSSNDTAFRLGYHWIGEIKPKIVVLCEPSPERLELLGESEIYQFLPSHPQPVADVIFYKHWLLNCNNGMLNKTKNKLALWLLCQQFGIKFISIDSNSMPCLDFARDLDHYGTESNSKFSKLVLEQIDH
jgi:hypothetical protein